jgi:hypothetical protein
VFALALFAAVYSWPSNGIPKAQSERSTAAISGTVVDSRGSAVLHATVAVKSQLTCASRSADSGNTGQFKITGTPEGRYTVVVTASGFAPATQ